VLYEKGVFKPLEPVELEEGTKLKIPLKEEDFLYTSITAAEEVFYIITRESLRNRGINNKPI